MEKILEQAQNKPQALNLLQHKVRHDNVLVVPYDTKGDDKVYHPDQYEDKPEWGIIIAVGDAVEGLKEGDIVVFGAYSSTVVRSQGHDFFYVRSEDIMSVYGE